MSNWNPKCSACGKSLKELDDGFRIDLNAPGNTVLCQHPAYIRGESDNPGCKDKVREAVEEWAENQGQQDLSKFLGSEVMSSDA